MTQGLARPTERKLDIYCPTSDVIAKLHQSTAPMRALIAGNRGGKTTTLVVEAVIRATGIVPEVLQNIYPEKRLQQPAFVRLVGVDFSNGVKKILEPEVLKWLPPEMIRGKNEEFHIIYLSNGSRIEFMSYQEPRVKFGGTSRHFIGLDEIPPPEILKENMMRVADVNGDILVGFTPVLDREDNEGRVTSNARAISFFYSEIYTKASRMVTPEVDVLNPEGHGGYECYHHRSSLNKHVNQEALDSWLSSLSPKEQAARRHGFFTHLAGLVYGDAYNEQKHLSDDFDLKELGWPVYCAIDPHPKTPHHVLYLTVDTYGRMFVCGELREPGIVSELAARMKAYEQQRGFWIVTRIIDPSANIRDPITGSCIAQELVNCGIFPLVPGSKDMLTGINRVRTAFKEDRLYICRGCKGMRWELANYIFAGDEPLDENDHFCENLRRLIMARPYHLNREVFESDLRRNPYWSRY